MPGGVNETHSRTIVMTTVFTALALGLGFQGGRFTRTPAYANILDIANQTTWAIAHAFVAVLVIGTFRYHTSRVYLTVTHTTSIILLATWWLAFVIRWFTDDSTTVVNVLSWGVFLYLAVRSLLLVDS